MTPLDIQKLYTRLREPGSNRLSKKKPLAPKTIKNIHLVLHKALAQAVRWGLRATNPADAVELPRQSHSETKAIATEELQRFMAAVQNAGEWRIPLLIAIGTGMRRGEIVALQWQDFNPERRLLVVRRALSHITTKEVEVSSTKTGKVRVVALNDSLVQVLSQQMKRLGLAITLHGLRHTHATALIAAGVPVKVISERLGHASVVITQDIYAHVMPTMQRQAVAALKNLNGAPSDKGG